MPKFIVILEGTLAEEWLIEAPSAQKAIEAVRGGNGEWLFNEWHGAPEASARRSRSRDGPVVPPGPE